MTDDAGKGPAGKGPHAATLEIAFQYRDAFIFGEPGQRSGVTVERGDPMAVFEQELRVTTTSGGEVEHVAFRGKKGDEAPYPVAGVGGGGVSGPGCHRGPRRNEGRGPIRSLSTGVTE